MLLLALLVRSPRLRAQGEWPVLLAIMETNSVHWTELGFHEDDFTEAFLSPACAHSMS